MYIYFLIFIFSILFVAIILFFERKIIAISQKRLSTSFLGRNGWVHTIGDVFKFWFKTINRHDNFKNLSIIGVLGTYLVWCLISIIFFLNFNNMNYFIFSDFQLFIYLTYVSITNIYTIFLILSLKSKYTSIAGLRLCLLTIFFEVPSTTLILTTYYMFSDYSFYMFINFSNSLFLISPIIFSIFIVYLLFESKRAPFDHTEAESELVAGHLLEFGGRTLFIFFLCEYIHFFFIIFFFILIFFNGFSFTLLYNLINITIL